MVYSLKDLIWRGQPLDTVQEAWPSKESVWSSEGWKCPGDSAWQQSRVWLCWSITQAGTNGPSSLTWGPGLGQGEERPGSNSMAPLVPSDFQLIYPESPNLPETLGAKI